MKSQLTPGVGNTSSLRPGGRRKPTARVLGCLIVCLLAAPAHAGELTGGGGASTGTTSAQTAPGPLTDPQKLSSGSSVSGTLSAGETRAYILDVRGGQYAHVEVGKGDLGLELSVCAPQPRPCLKSIARRYGKVDISFVADVSGEHRIEVRSLEGDSVGRPYELRVIEVANATARQRLVGRAVRAAGEAETLRERPDASSQSAAAAKYDEARQSWESAGEYGRAAGALCDVGDVYFNLSQYRRSLDSYAKALATAEHGGDSLARLAALNGIGYANVYLGENQKALAYAREALDFIRRTEPAARASADYRRAEARALNTIGEVRYSLGELRKSVEVFGQALSLWAEVGQRSGEALALLNLGYSYSDLGDLRNADENFERSLLLWQAVGDTRGAALAQTALGGVHSLLGEEQTALELHGQAVEHFRAMGNKQGEAATLNGIARVYQDLNDYQSALDNYSEALRLYQSIGNRDFEALNKFLIGRVLYQRGEIGQALLHYRESLKLSRGVGDRVIEGHALKGLGTIYFSQGDKTRAISLFGEALGIYRQLGNRRSQAYVLNDLGHVLAYSGDVQGALSDYEQALPLMRDTGDRHGEALTLFNAARAERDLNDLPTARSLVEESISISESIRAKTGNSQLRTSFFVSAQQQYELLVNVLMRMHGQHPDLGLDVAALMASERARARSLLDSILSGRLEPRNDASADLLPREQEILRALDEKAEYQTRLLSGQHTEEEAQRASDEIRGLTSSYFEVRSRLREQSPRYALLTQPPDLSVETLKGIVRDDTLLLEFALGDEQSFLWVVGKDGITSYELPGRSAVESLARKVYGLLTARQVAAAEPPPASDDQVMKAEAEYWTESVKLSNMLLGPAAGRLGSKRLLIVGDGFLRYVPFEALPTPAAAPAREGDGESNVAQPKMLFFQHEIVGLPSALTLVALRSETRLAPPVSKTIAVIADPVFERDDPRVLANGGGGAPEGGESSSIYLSSALRNFSQDSAAPSVSRLPATLREAELIRSATAPGEGTFATGFAATREALTADGLEGYRIIHIATHGLLNTENPELSGVILSLVDERGNSREGFLRLHDIYNLTLSADLVVLSACRTGLGKDVRGEGVVGLSSGFMYAGAKGVVASLWKVDDEATADLMGHFYAAMLKEGLPPGAALRKAKLEMWRQDRWRPPFYWAAFVIQGEYAEDIGATRHPPSTIIVIICSAVAASGVCVYALVRRRRRRARVALRPPQSA
jgi:CHAT domain-containing protein/tetratricopeptide (TPR) repeat protein